MYVIIRGEIFTCHLKYCMRDPYLESLPTLWYYTPTLWYYTKTL